jgi:lipopolysaccharide/colanic/teichoic acid biosynthesis glycosyltransferase
MTSIKSAHIDFKIAQPDADFIIGSNSIETSGETYKLNINKLSRPENLRSKRFLDITIALALLLSSPLMVWIYRDKRGIFENIFNVIVGSKTWVGFIPTNTTYKDPQLPALTRGVLTPVPTIMYEERVIHDKLNLLYARDYSILTDIRIILGSFRKLDQQS